MQKAIITKMQLAQPKALPWSLSLLGIIKSQSANTHYLPLSLQLSACQQIAKIKPWHLSVIKEEVHYSSNIGPKYGLKRKFGLKKKC